MLRSLSFQNYRAFKTGRYPVRPITVFVGQNSIGKTSALQVPLLLKQTAQIAGTSYMSAFKVQGRELSYGEPLKLLHKLNAADPMSIGIEIDSPYLLNVLTQSLAQRFIFSIERIAQHYAVMARTHQKANNKDGRLFRSLTKLMDIDVKRLIQSDESIFDPILEAKDRFSQQQGAADMSLPLMHYRTSARQPSRRRMPGVRLASLSKLDINRTHSFIKSLSAIDSTLFQIEFDAKFLEQDRNRFLRLSRFSITSPKSTKNNIIEISFADGEISSVESSYANSTDLNAYNKTLSKLFSPNGDIFSLAEGGLPDDVQFFFPDLIRTLSAEFSDTAEEYFSEDRVGHIGPLRAHPKRFYMLDTAQAGSSEGDLLVEALRENETLRERINTWLQNFQINISVSQFAEIIYRLSVRSKSNDFDLDITDVGFGISQILPILAEGFLSQPHRLIVVEQPEIHLHPKMQADLADLFIDMAGVRKDQERERKYFLIETHSEYLLNRLRRRLAEGAVSHEDVALVFVEAASEGGASLRSVHVPTDGSFEWPKGFRDTSVDDALAFAMAAKRGS